MGDRTFNKCNSKKSVITTVENETIMGKRGVYLTMF